MAGEMGTLYESPESRRRPSSVAMMVLAGLLVAVGVVVATSSHKKFGSADTDLHATAGKGNYLGLVEPPYLASDACDDKYFTKQTIQILGEQKFGGMFQNLQKSRKFEASDVVLIGDFYYVVFDSLYTVGKIAMDLPFYSKRNELLAAPGHPILEESSFEGITQDPRTGNVYLVQESIHSVEYNGTSEDVYRAMIQEAILPSEAHAKSQYTTVGGNCKTEFTFTGDSKGFEGITAFEHNGETLLMGLCEGNFCSNTDGVKNDPGHGRAVVMRRSSLGSNGTCTWETEKIVHIPQSAFFIDYSAIALSSRTGRVAITSQENATVWMGRFDMETLEFEEDQINSNGSPTNTVFNFPRNSACEMEYCNIEGIAWLDEESGTLVTTSDQMKGKGKQSADCFKKDQSMQIIQVPTCGGNLEC